MMHLAGCTAACKLECGCCKDEAEWYFAMKEVRGWHRVGGSEFLF